MSAVGDARKRLAAAPDAGTDVKAVAAERKRLARQAADGGILTIRDLCNDHDLERYDSHDYCTQHDVEVPTDGVCPVTLGIVAALIAAAEARGAAEGAQAVFEAVQDEFDRLRRPGDPLAETAMFRAAARAAAQQAAPNA